MRIGITPFLEGKFNNYDWRCFNLRDHICKTHCSWLITPNPNPNPHRVKFELDTSLPRHHTWTMEDAHLTYTTWNTKSTTRASSLQVNQLLHNYYPRNSIFLMWRRLWILSIRCLPSSSHFLLFSYMISVCFCLHILYISPFMRPECS